MRPSPEPENPDLCPFLFPVVADQLWMTPVGGYCRRPDHPVRVPATSTMAAVCATVAHRRCEGYLDAVDDLVKDVAP